MGRRREHSRTNKFGTSFTVREHAFTQGERTGSSIYKLTHSGGQAYVNGSVTFNIRCPGCSKPVFFYQNDHGSRVFFDKLGKPWPKHNCPNWDPVFETAPIRLGSSVLYAGEAYVSKDLPVLNVTELYRRRGLTKKHRQAERLRRDEKAALKREAEREKQRQAALLRNKAEWKAAGSPMPRRSKKSPKVIVEVKQMKRIKRNLKGQDENE